jgi:hypothetical protein
MEADMKIFAKKNLSRSLRLLVLMAIAMTTLSVKLSAALLKVGDEYGGGKVANIIQPGDKDYADIAVQAVIIGKADISVNIYWSEAKTSMDRIDAIGYNEVNFQQNAHQNQLAIGSTPEKSYRNSLDH